jgi:hypothetical protein
MSGMKIDQAKVMVFTKHSTKLYVMLVAAQEVPGVRKGVPPADAVGCTSYQSKNINDIN